MQPTVGPGTQVSRVTALFLAVLVPLQFAVVVLRDGIGPTAFVGITHRWEVAGWQGLEWVTLTLALAHAGLALGAAIRRSVRHPTLRAVLAGGVAILAIGLVAGVTWAMLTYS
jgi:succinate dehydrogenase hydrophobic anchor subunit